MGPFGAFVVAFVVALFVVVGVCVVEVVVVVVDFFIVGRSGISFANFRCGRNHLSVPVLGDS